MSAIDSFTLVGVSGSSDVIVELLGVVAVIAFLGTIAFVAAVQVQDQAKRRAARSLGNMGLGASVADAPMSSAPLAQFDDGFKADRKRAQDGYRAYYDSTVHAAKKKLEELIPRAASGFRHLSDAYGQNSYGMNGERRPSRIARFEAICERQWAVFKSDLPYIDYQEVQEHLRHVLDAYGMLSDGASAAALGTEEETTPEALRSLEIVSALRAVPREKIEALQDEMLEAVGPFKEYFQRHVREWVNDRIFRLIGKLRERSEHGVSIDDTDMKDKMVRLRSRLEIVARLAERLSENTHRIEEGGIALSQVVYVGAVLHMLMQMSEWFPEVAPPVGAADDADATSNDVKAVARR